MTNATIQERNVRLTTPRSAALAGIIFALLFAASLVLLRLAIPSDLTGEIGWITQARNYLSIALVLMPFAGIAFLWFIGVIRDRFGEFEDRFFSTVFFGSSLLFIGMVFVAMAVAGALVVMFDYLGFISLLMLGLLVLIRRNNLNSPEIIASSIMVLLSIALSLIHISDPTRPNLVYSMHSSD